MPIQIVKVDDLKPIIGTHSQSFHVDEILACSMLVKIIPDAKVVRSRDPEILQKCDYVVDCGNVYDHSTKR